MAGASVAPETSPTLVGRLRAVPADENAWRDFVSIYGVHLLHWAKNWGLQDADAEDVTQATLLRLAKAMRDFDYDPKLTVCPIRGVRRRFDSGTPVPRPWGGGG
jgi:RNA polymerase sigma-70 factor (ECF subfamily)